MGTPTSTSVVRKGGRRAIASIVPWVTLHVPLLIIEIDYFLLAAIHETEADDRRDVGHRD